MAGPAVIVRYDADWPVRAQALLREIEFAFGSLPGADHYVYEHIGSTAVPGLAAKPFVDLQVRMPTLPALDDLAVLTEPIGFEIARGARPDSPGVYRDVARPGDTATDAAYRKRLFYSPRHRAILHVRPSESPFADFVVIFRDWLRAQPEEAHRYAQLKRRTAERHAGDADYDDYTRAKSAYFDAIEPRMRNWAQHRTRALP